MPSIVEFVDELPPRSGGNQGGEHVKIAEALRKRPGQWARVFKNVRSATSASTINTAGATAYQPRGAFKATSRQTAKGQYDIYAQYVGEPSKA